MSRFIECHECAFSATAAQADCAITQLKLLAQDWLDLLLGEEVPALPDRENRRQTIALDYAQHVADTLEAINAILTQLRAGRRAPSDMPPEMFDRGIGIPTGCRIGDPIYQSTRIRHAAIRVATTAVQCGICPEMPEDPKRIEFVRRLVLVAAHQLIHNRHAVDSASLVGERSIASRRRLLDGTGVNGD